MSLVSSMYTAANGIQSHSDAMNVVSDNVANVSTVGFKAGMARFQDVIASTPYNTTNSTLSGQGSHVSGVEESFAQGALLSTGGGLDLAMQGDGFFMVNGSYNGEAGTFYTRAGQFHVNSIGKLVNFDGLTVQGYQGNSAGVLGTSVGDIVMDQYALIPPNATANVSVSANLDASSATVAAAFDNTLATNAAATSTWNNTVTVYDSLGAAHTATVYYRNGGTGAWDWHALVDGSEISGGTAGTPVEIAGGTLQFGTNGTLTSSTTATSSASFINATAAQTINWNFGDPTASNGTGTAGITSYVGTSTTTKITQDGFNEGAFAGATVSSDGTIMGQFTNGVQRTIGQLAIANFTADQGLERIGGTLWASTLASGTPAIGAAGAGGRGAVASGTLEQSNVNLSQEFINLMTYQRGFEANTRTVSAADRMMQELVNLGR